MSEPTPRQLLYALVAGGFLAVVLVLIVGAGVTGVVSVSWTAVMAVVWLVVALWSASNWRRTVPVLLLAIAMFLSWAVATVLISSS